MKVSIITPAYNAENNISDCINSVLSQTYENWEMFIVDDASTDNTVSIIKHYQSLDKRIKLINSSKNKGPAMARNLAIAAATGRYIAFLDSDDLWLSHKLSTQLEFMNNQHVVLCYSSYKVINENGIELSNYRIPKLAVNYKTLLKGCIIGNLTAIYDSKILGKVYMEDVGHEDYTLWLKILKNVDFAYGINDVLAEYRISSHSVSRNKIKSAAWQWNIYRKIEKISVTRSLYYFLHYAINGLRKYN